MIDDGVIAALEEYLPAAPAHNAIYLTGIRAFQEAMHAKEVRCDIQIYEGAAHGFFNAGRRGDRYFHLTRDAMDGFLVSMGWLNASPE